MSAFLLGVPAKLKTLIDRLTATRAAKLDNLDVVLSTRLSAAGYTAPDNSGISTIIAYVDELEARLTAVRAGKLDAITEARLAKLDVALATGIKSIQRGTIAVTGTNLTATATITSVDTAKTELRFQGMSMQADAAWPARTSLRITLTNATTITATRGEGVSLNDVTVNWELTEYY